MGAHPDRAARRAGEPPGALAAARPPRRGSRWSPCCPSRSGVYAMYVVDGARDAARGVPGRVRSFYGQLERAGRRGAGDRDRLAHARPRRHHPRHPVAGRRRGGDSRRPTTARRPAWAAPWPSCRRIGGDASASSASGAGTLVAYGRPGDVYRVYEINPQVVRLAETEFTLPPRIARPRSPSCLGDARRTARGGAAPGVRPPRRRRVLGRFDSRAPPDPGGADALHAPPRPRRASSPSTCRTDSWTSSPVLAAGARALGRPAINVLGDGDRRPALLRTRSGFSSRRADGPDAVPGALAARHRRSSPRRDSARGPTTCWSLYPVLLGKGHR